MDQLNDAEVAKRLLDHLARGFGCPDAAYIAGPARIQGGFDTAIFGFTLDHAPPALTGPLILRLCRPGTDPGRVKLETVVQNTLVEMGFPAPRVMVTESDPGILGGPFMLMTRLSGQTLAHGIEGLGAGTSLIGQLQLLQPSGRACPDNRPMGSHADPPASIAGRNPAAGGERGGHRRGSHHLRRPVGTA